MFDFENINYNTFKKGNMVKIDCLCNQEGNELEEQDQRYEDLFKEGKIDSVYGSDISGSYVYGVQGAKWCFNKYELKLAED